METIETMKRRTDVPVIVADHQGFVVYINPNFTTVFGWETEDILGQPLTKILPNSFRDAHNLAFSRFQANEQSKVLNHPLQLKAITKNNQEILTEHFIVAEKIDAQWFFSAILRPLAATS
jgi:PAS domain S-box-containing protein